MCEQLIDLAEWGTSKPTLVYCATIWCVELSRPEICHLVGVREDGKQSDESIFGKIGVFNRLKIS
jgi:hypothetical protein